MTFTQELKVLIAEKSLLTHPFYQAWTAGTLPLSVMQVYAEQYYHLEKNFPNFLSALLMTAENETTRAEIVENFMDEASGTQHHRELWLQFGEGIGATREAMKASKMFEETAETVDIFDTLSKRSFLLGAAALAAYESQVPEVAKEKIEGLVRNYGIESEATLQFFRVHGTMDVVHADAWWDLIERHCDDEATRQAVRDAVIQGRDALWNFLSGILKATAVTVE